jgi:predicted RNA methylase
MVPLTRMRRLLAIAALVLVDVAASRGVCAQTKSSDIGFAPTPQAVVDLMLATAEVTNRDVVYDLGSGDGRILIAAAKTYGARGVGIEIDPQLVRVARQAASDNGVSHLVTFVEGDLFAQDLSPATVVTLFLWPSVNKRLEAKLRGELKTGARVVSNTFGIGNWKPEKVVRGPGGSDVLVWVVPRAPARQPDVPFEPTPEPIVYEMLEAAATTSRDVVCDLGSGDGRIPILAAQKYGARAIGIELDPRLVEISREVARDAQLADRVTFVEGDLFEASCPGATVVTLALSGAGNAKLEAKLRRELSAGARIVSRHHRLGTWNPERSIRASDGSTLFVWIVR